MKPFIVKGNPIVQSKGRPRMRNVDLRSMPLDELRKLHEELWKLHEQVTQVATELAQKMTAERATIEKRLRRLKPGTRQIRARRPYPKVMPKYRNPKNRRETWAGRGSRPRWLAAQLRSGKKLNEFLIRHAH